MKAVPLLEVSNLKKYFPIEGGIFNRQKNYVQAVDGISFNLAHAETLGVVGESGCGKSTLARLLIKLIEPDDGLIQFEGRLVGRSDGIELRQLRRRMQMVFQDSFASLNPRLTIDETIAFSPRAHGASRESARKKTQRLLSLVGLEPTQFQRRYPHELSGGQRQRVNIARALALDPKVLIMDEAVSALDKSVQAQILNLLADLRRDLGLTYLFISHDLHIVRYLCDRVMVMYLGKIAEIGSVEDIYDRPLHPYTRALLAAVPTTDPDRPTQHASLTGDPPNPINPPSGCRFRTRCAFAEDVCARTPPPLSAAFSSGHAVACHMATIGSGHSRAPQPGNRP